MSQQGASQKYLYYSNKFMWKLSYSGGLMIHRLIKLLPIYYRERILYRLVYQNHRSFASNYAAGFSHNYSYMVRCIIEAVLHHRTPVIHPMICDTRHNFNHWVPNDWQDYYDLDHSSIIYDDGRKVPLSYIKSSAFLPLLRSAKDEILVMNYRDAIQPQDNSRYRYIIRQVKPVLYLKKLPKHINFQVSLKETAAIRDIGDAIIEQLGDFYLLHYRYPDQWSFGRDYPPQYLSLLDVNHLVEKLKFPPNSVLYIMSNVWRQPDYFAALNSRYRVFTYQDFPQLKRIVESEHPNTFLLLAIERYLMKKALDWTAINRNYFLSKQPTEKT